MRWWRHVLPATVLALALTGCGTADLDRSSGGDPAGPDETESEISLAGAVALDNCSGALMRFTTSEVTDAALVLTAGHCHEDGFIASGLTLVDQPTSRAMALLDADGDEAGRLRASSIVYATMTDTDALLYELDQTYAEIEQATGVSALVLAEEQPSVGAEISVLAGYWKRIYSCTVDSYVYRMHEADWTWRQSMQYRQPGCEIVAGTSGGPVIRHDTGEIAAINNTANVRGRRCTLNNPCEETQSGEISVEQGEAYAQQSTWFYSCLTETRELDLSLDGCRLPVTAY
jgi:V8-like Glu-specific endopeptidase